MVVGTMHDVVFGFSLTVAVVDLAWGIRDRASGRPLGSALLVLAVAVGVCLYLLARH